MASEEMTLDEDPASFFARITKECPEVFSILTTKLIHLISRSPHDPYTQENVNQEYLTDEGAYHRTRKTWKKSEVKLKDYILDPKGSAEILSPTDFEAFKRRTSTLEAVTKRARLVIEARLRATEEKLGRNSLPRLIRLCKRYKFSEIETKMATHSLAFQGGFDGSPRYAYGGLGFGENNFYDTTCQLLDVSQENFLSFFSSERLHMKQGIFAENRVNRLRDKGISYNGEFLNALIQSKLSSDTFLKIEKTELGAVILEEPGSDYLRIKGEGTQDLNEQPVGNLPSEKTSGTQKEETELDSGLDEQEPEDLDLDTILQVEREREHGLSAVHLEDSSVKEEKENTFKPYKTDFEYLDDHFRLIVTKMKVRAIERRIEDDIRCCEYDGYCQPQTQYFLGFQKEAEIKEKTLERLCEKRLALTRAAGSWIPRLERIVKSRKLCDFERLALIALIGAALQPKRFVSNEVCHALRFIQRRRKQQENEDSEKDNIMKVGDLLQKICSNLKDEIENRKYFYKSSTLVREGMIVVHGSGISGDPSTAFVEVDRRMLDFCVGLETEFSEVVEGSHLYFPKTKFELVILPKEQKDLILDSVSSFESYKRSRKQAGLDDTITYGAGMVMLFHGAPGTGKTMMANALANKLSKKVLLINFPSLGAMKADDNFKFVFREAKINDAILFFDECEAIFESRERGGQDVSLLLTEIERHDGMIILATNRPYDLDEAMHRRIMIAIEFRQPDHLLRKTIWETHMPEQMKLADDIDIENLAMRFELAGGFIKNAILSALSNAVSRDGDSPVVSQKDLLQGASLQLRGRLRMKDFDRRVVPAAGLDEVVVEESIMKQLKQIVQFEKARAILFGQWGFAKRNHKGLTVLLHGSPGTGKTLVAEAIGYEVGKALKVVNCGELLSKWVGESSKNINAIFQEAQHQDAILVFDEAEGLFGQRTSTTTSTDRYANIDIGVLLHHIERFPGIVILTTNLIENLDMAFFRRLHFVLHLKIPHQSLRANLWKLIVSSETPLADDVDFEKLSHHELCGGSIKNAVYRAAAEAALRSEGKQIVTMEDLERSCKEESKAGTERLGFQRQDSDTIKMYN